MRHTIIKLSLFTAVICGFSVCLHAGERKTAIERLNADLTFLASDECEGRGPGTKGIDLAADHIVAVFKDAGLRGINPEGSYFQPFTINGQPKVAQPTSFAITTPEATITPSLKHGFEPYTRAAAGKVKGDIVFVGYGVTAPDQNYDDYAGVEVEGKIVLMLRRIPHYGNKEKPFGSEEVVNKHAAIKTKIENAEQHKAAGVIIVNDNTTLEEISNDKIDGVTTLPLGDVKIPAIHMKRHLAGSLIRSAYEGKTLGDLEEKINADLKPVSKQLSDCTAALEVTIERKATPAKNVVGVLPGVGPLADETVVIGAHYDHLGLGGRGSLQRDSKEIHHGADDNGSGTTALLELVRRIGGIKDRQGRRVVFIAFSGEELGLLGSAHYCKEPIFPLENTVAMLNLDMVGRLKEDKETQKSSLEIGGTATAKQFDALLDKHNEKYDFKIRKSKPGGGPSDHASFSAKGLPVLFFFTGLHADYHRPSDTADKINYEGMARIVDYVEEIARDVIVMDPKPEYVKVTEKSTLSVDEQRSATRPRAALRLMPDYNAEGEGLRVGGVIPGGPAEKAGIKEGDRIVELAGKPVRDTQTYMDALRRAQPGNPLDIVVIRINADKKEERIKITATPEGSKE